MSIVQSLWKGQLAVYSTPLGEWRARAKEVAERHGVTFDAMMTAPGRGPAAKARKEAMRAVRAMTWPDGSPRFSYPQIGRFFNRDHSTVQVACKGRRSQKAGAIHT